MLSRALGPLAAMLAAIGLLAASPHARAVAERPTPARPSTTWCADQCDGVIVDWSLVAYQAIKAADGYRDPMAASRSLAMMHLAMHDAVNSVEPRYRSYALVVPRARSDADAAVAAAAAAHGVLAALYPQPQASAVLDVHLSKTLLAAGSGPAIEAGRALGAASAAATLALRADDGSARTERYTEGTRAGEYRFTPPFDFAAAPHWRAVTPFALTSATQFRTSPAPALASEQYRRAFDEVKRVGGRTAGAARSEDETRYAAFWYEFSDIGWNRVARAAAGRVPQDLWERARTFALLNMAMADAYVAGWDSKYHYNFWRPVTAIHRAAADGNPHTAPDAKFEPLLPTPPVPDMPSTHSALGMAAATVLAHELGRDDVGFSFASSTALPDQPVRSFASFSEAARENADSRVKAGLHFRFATEAGLELGRRVGEHVVRHALPRAPEALAARD